ncbi:hypothetical protein DET50_104143 [Marinobacter pelagius]|uniref:Lipoprotein n=1 Tax=Marinobacter pelagius TaxID=379482 RepID=A0A366GWR6_9GAMM|nr:hypothetical protein [Marinobacter pelagius]RBP32374.1 hypothetical protein DET50_104143 [Marinobacter pelagius]
MRTLFQLGSIGLLVALLSGCFGGSSNGRPNPSVDFTTFVKAQIAATGKVKAPVAVNPVDFSFNDQNNPQAYDDLFR